MVQGVNDTYDLNRVTVSKSEMDDDPSRRESRLILIGQNVSVFLSQKLHYYHSAVHLNLCCGFAGRNLNMERLQSTLSAAILPPQACV